MEELNNGHNNIGTILKELSDIKSSLAVNTNETANIKASVAEIKNDIREIKNDYIIRREFNEANVVLRKEFADANSLIKQEFVDSIKSLKKDINIPKKILYGILSAAGLAVLGALLKLVIK